MKISELPKEIKEKALEYQKEDAEKYEWYNETTDQLEDAFDWEKTKEGIKFWSEVNNGIPQQPIHYDNSKGSLYQFCEQQQLNSYEFDLIKRIMRCRKKGNFIEDLEKTKFLIDLYIKETKCES